MACDFEALLRRLNGEYQRVTQENNALQKEVKVLKSHNGELQDFLVPFERSDMQSAGADCSLESIKLESKDCEDASTMVSKEMATDRMPAKQVSTQSSEDFFTRPVPAENSVCTLSSYMEAAQSEKSMGPRPSFSGDGYGKSEMEYANRASKLAQHLQHQAGHSGSKVDEDGEPISPDPTTAKRKVHLSKDAQLRFGTKFTSEGSSRSQRPDLRKRIRRTLTSDWFEWTIAALITGNGLVMCFEVQYTGLLIGSDLKYSGYGGVHDLDQLWSAARALFAVLDWTFGILFLFECALQLAAYRFQYFCSAWNLIDFACVVAFGISKMAMIFPEISVNGKVIRLLRLFRLVRLNRLIRHLERLDMLYIMATAIKGMTSIVVWSMVLLFVILMTCALFLSQYLQATYFEGVTHETLSKDELKDYHELYSYFGSFSRCMFSMFEITLGNWPPVARLLMERISEWFSLICVAHKLTIGFAIIGVINGCILQETFKVAATDDLIMVRQKSRQKDALRRKMTALFEALDLDKSGCLDFPEFMIIASQPEVMLWLESLDIEVDDLLTLFMLLDEEGKGTFTLDELLSQVPRLRGHARGIDMLALRKGIPQFHRQMVTGEEASEFKFEQMPKVSEGSMQDLADTHFVWPSAEEGNKSQTSLGAMLKRSNSLRSQSSKSSHNSW